MRKICLLVALFLSTVTISYSQTEEKPQAPDLEYVLELRVTIGEAINVGSTSHGDRVVIPITGGTFEGPNIKGKILSGGADYQYVDKEQNRNEVEAIYCIQTDDGVNIHVRNCGLIYTSKDANGQPSFYFRTAPKFEAPIESKYNWLNNAIFVCVPSFSPDYIILKVWMVK